MSDLFRILFPFGGIPCAGLLAMLMCPNVFASPGPEDLAASLAKPVEMLLAAAAAPSISMPLWKVRDDNRATYRRNRIVWTGQSVDLTGKAVWNSWSGAFGTTAISPRHIVYAHHVKGLYPEGTLVRFVTRDDMVFESFVSSSVRIGESDIDLSTLDVSLPKSIHWFKVMPEHWFLKCSMRVPGSQKPIPSIVMDGNTQTVSVKDLASFFPGGYMTDDSPDSPRRSFSVTLRSGDSGSPEFLLVGSELVLDGIYTTARTGAEVSSSISLLNAAMHGSGYQVGVADLSTRAAP